MSYRRFAPQPGASSVVFRLALSLVTGGILAATGCSQTQNGFEFVDYRSTGETKRYREAFDEGYYDLNSAGDLTLVLRRNQPAEENLPDVTQVLVIKGVWRCIPGTTITHDTQLNATMVYSIGSGRSGNTFEGAGSLFFSPNRREDEISGSIDLATLRPKKSVGGGEALFERLELKGSFHAKRDPLRVRRIVNDHERQFYLKKT